MTALPGRPLRRFHPREARALDELLRAPAPPAVGEVSEEDLGDLPPPARRFLARAAPVGTPLVRAAWLRMSGALTLRRGGPPTPFVALERLEPPRALVWVARAGSGPMAIHGADVYAGGEGRTRWFLGGLVPVVRAAGEDGSRSAFGRAAGEALWGPTALLPRCGGRWEALDDARAACVLRDGEREARLELEVDATGRVTRLSLERWREAARGREAGHRAFDVGVLEAERPLGPFRLPSRASAGWREDGAPFIRMEIEELLLEPPAELAERLAVGRASPDRA